MSRVWSLDPVLRPPRQICSPTRHQPSPNPPHRDLRTRQTTSTLLLARQWLRSEVEVPKSISEPNLQTRLMANKQLRTRTTRVTRPNSSRSWMSLLCGPCSESSSGQTTVKRILVSGSMFRTSRRSLRPHPLSPTPMPTRIEWAMPLWRSINRS